MQKLTQRNGLTVQQAMQEPLSAYANVNVTLWAKPDHYDGTQARFALESEAFIGLDCPPGFKEVWSLALIEINRQQGKSESDILTMIHSWYRVPQGMGNPY